MRALGEYLQRHPRYGKRPDHPKKCPTPCTTQHAKRKWRVRTSDKKKDRGMLESPKHQLGLACRKGVIEGGGKVEEYGGRREETCADQESSVRVACCVHDEKWACDECGDQRYAMADAVRYFFRSRLLTGGASKQNAHASSFLFCSFDYALNFKVLRLFGCIKR